jgi:hypothetical protein
VPPIFPENLHIQSRNGLIKLAFSVTPNLDKPEDITIIADILATPGFALGITEHIIAILRRLDLPSTPRPERIEKIAESLINKQESE